MSTESIPNKRRLIPPLNEVPLYKISPLFAKYRTRTIVIYIFMCLIGILPYVLNTTGIANMSPGLQAAGWGLIIPGGAFIACGTLWGVILGILIFAFFYKFAMQIMMSTGIIMLNLYLWVLSIIGGFFTAKGDTPVYSIAIIVALLIFTIIVKSRLSNKNYKIRLEKRDLHEKYLVEEVALHEKLVAESVPLTNRELDEDSVKASRYLFEMTLREPGDFTGYESVEQSQYSAYRYSLDYLGYTLAMMQCHYTPNFHGYLNQAQRFIIESFTMPSVCSYWKWSYFGGMFRWNPDPIGNLNIMFSGWSGVPITLYGANTGDLRYEKPGALKFKPSIKSSKTYDYSSKDIVEVLARQFKEYRTRLFPCEPNWVFPLCNAYGWNAILPYDRYHHTTYLEEIYDELSKYLKENFIEVSGDICSLRNSLFGFRSLENLPAEYDGLNSFGMTRLLNPVDPGLAKRSYIFGKKDYLFYENGELVTSLGKWDNMLDFGNFKKSPGYIIGSLAVAACEMGDRKLVKDLLEVADKFMVRYEDNSVLAYKAASISGNANIICARFAQKDDWYNMMHKGPGEGAFKGPILTECKYPEVLVAKAKSDGNDLDLVLYNGHKPGIQELGIERLKPGCDYGIKGTDILFKADHLGKASVNVILDGRTTIHITPA